jgi:hypothetical protein
MRLEMREIIERLKNFILIPEKILLSEIRSDYIKSWLKKTVTEAFYDRQLENC